jgi:hypothetical protein
MTGHTGCTWSSAWAYRVRPRGDALRELDAAAALRAVLVRPADAQSADLEAAGRPAEAGKAFLDAWHLDTGDPVKGRIT